MEKTPIYEFIKKRRKEGVKELFERYGKKLYGYAIHSWKLSEDDAWELVYTALYKVLENIEKYSFISDKEFGSFLFTVFINLVKNHLRDQKSIPFESLENIQEPGTEIQEPGEDHTQMMLLKTELDKLEDWERILLLLRSQDMPYADIAKYTGKSADVLKVYYGRLKEKLSRKLNPVKLKNEMK